jgi:hypothetical protein
MGTHGNGVIIADSICAQRGRIVRAIVSHVGTVRVDSLFTAYADAGEFNRNHPEIAIPAPLDILGTASVLVKQCGFCQGEGVNDGERVCFDCEGSGFSGIRGVGSSARKAYV